MKKILLFIAFFAFTANRVNAQLSVHANGHVDVAGTEAGAKLSTFSVRGGMAGYEAAVSGAKRGVYGAATGEYLWWSHGVYGKSIGDSALFRNGVFGIAVHDTPRTNGRTYGVYGIAGNATNGWNYGVFGQLNGTNKGAGVYGTATHGENGARVDGRYAGYFNGPTKVDGDLKVTGTIFGTALQIQPASVTPAPAMAKSYGSPSVSDKLAMLSPVSYYENSTANRVKANDNVTDTASVVRSPNKMQSLMAERMHYGLDTETLSQTFPELVYEQEDGTVGINYMEMIPLLIQAINNLKTEVNTLKARVARSAIERSSTTVNLSTDGKVIGTKRVISK